MDGGEGCFRGVPLSMLFNSYPVPVLAYVNKSKMLVVREGFHHQRSREQKCYMSAGECREVYRKGKSNSSRANCGMGRSVVCCLRHRFSGTAVDWLLAFIAEEFWNFSQFLQEHFVTVSCKKKRGVNAYTVTYKPFVRTSSLTVWYVSLQVESLK